MTKAPKIEISAVDALTLALFAQRSPNAAFRERAFTLALATLTGPPAPASLRPLAEFAARSEARGASAEAARQTARRILGEAGHADLWRQLAGSASRERDALPPRPPRSRPPRRAR